MMVDIDALREAIKYVRSGPGFIDWGHMSVLADGGEQFLRLMETGEKGEWCIAHKSSNWSRSSVCDVVALMLVQGQMPSRCRMVEGVLTIREDL